MKKLFKRLYKTHSFLAVTCWLIACYMRFTYYTSRKTCDIDAAAMPYVRGELPAIFSFWHSRLLMMSMLCPPKRKMNVLISSHRDGELIATAMRRFGLSTISGSSTRGGGTAAIRAVKALQAGENVAITPDGPRGPAMQAQPGIVAIAEMAKVPVVYAAYSASRHRRMRSWDRFMLALPFSRIYYRVGLLAEGITTENINTNMNRITAEVDAHAAI